MASFHKEGQVSIWLSTVPSGEIPDDYFMENCGREEGEPFTVFSSDFGFDWYDHDFVDTNCHDEHTRSIEELIGQCSFSSSYVKDVVSEARRRGLEQSAFAFLLYDYQYQPDVTGIRKSAYMEFLGSFPYDPVADSAIPYQA